VKSKTGPSSLLDMVEGLLEGRVQAVARGPAEGMAGPGRGGRAGRVHGFKTAAAEELPDAVEVMDPFHVVGLATDALDDTRSQVLHDTLGRRGRAGDPLVARPSQ